MGYVVNHNPNDRGQCEEKKQRPCEDFCTFDWMGNHVIGVDDGEFSVPQMICIPDSWTDDAGNTVRWCWPAERISIESAYPRFRDWVKKAEGNEDWYKTVNENLVIKRTR